MEPIDIEQHNAEIHENKRHWDRKAGLRSVYHAFYREIAARLQGIETSTILECGSGIGALKEILPEAITSDIFPNPWLDRTENVYALSFPDESLSAVILFDVFHHLEYPGTALAELGRALKPGGRVIIWEPAMGVLGRVVLGLFHHEPLGLAKPVSWTAAPSQDLRTAPYYAAQGNAWRIFGRRESCADLSGWKVREIAYFPALEWLLSGGFRGPELCPAPLLGAVRLLNRLLSLAPRFFASRMLVVLDKVDPAQDSKG